MEDLGSVVAAVRAKALATGPTAYNEQNTCAVLIEPVLDALGWDTGDLAAVDRQFRVFDGTRLDYALKLDGKPVLFVEAKGLGQPLDDPKYISQTLNYANNEGVVWCVLTNGMLYRIYKTNEPVAMDKKLMVEVDLGAFDGDPAKAVVLQALGYLSRASLEQGTLDTLAELVFTGGRVRQALEALLAKPSPTFRKAIEQVSGQPLEADRLDRILRYFSVVQRSPSPGKPLAQGPVIAAPAQSLESSPAKPTYSKEHHFASKPQAIVDLYDQLEERVRALGDVVVTFTKMYVNFSAPKHSLMTVVAGRDKIYLYFSIPWDLAPKTREDRMRKVTQIGHYGMGDTEFVLSAADQLDDALVLAAASYARNHLK